MNVLKKHETEVGKEKAKESEEKQVHIQKNEEGRGKRAARGNLTPAKGKK